MRTAAQQIEHYKAVRARMGAGGPARPVVSTLILGPRPVARPAEWANPVYVYSAPVGPISPPSAARSVSWHGLHEGMKKKALRILRAVADTHLVSVEHILSRSRCADYQIARQEAAWRLRDETGWSYPRIGLVMGGRDHTSILHACRRHEARIAKANELGVSVVEIGVIERRERAQYFSNLHKGVPKKTKARMLAKAVKMADDVRGAQ